MQRFKLGIIGTRQAGRTFHIEHLGQMPERVDLAICDINEETLNKAGDAGNIAPQKRYSDYREMIKAEQPQAVVVSISQYGRKNNNFNPAAYFRIVNEIIDMGIPVMVEKPLAMTVEDASPLAEKAKRKDLLTMVNVNRRFNPLLAFCMKEVLKHGPVLTAQCQFFKGTVDGQNDTNDWLTGDMIHALDLLRYICGSELASISGAKSTIKGDPQPTSFHSLMRFENGCNGTFSSNVRVGGRRELWQIHARNISVYISTDFSLGNQQRMKAGICKYPPVINGAEFHNSIDIKEYWDYNISGTDMWQINRGFRDSDLYFMDCVEKNIKPHCDFEDNLKTIKCGAEILNAPDDIISL